jgi:hypothetical protein
VKKETNVKGFYSLSCRTLGIAAVMATVSSVSGQTVRVPFHEQPGSQAGGLHDAKVAKEGAIAAGGVGAKEAKKITRKDTCWLFPLAGKTCAGSTDPNPGDAPSDRYNNINKFYDTAGQFSFFNQVKAIYNGASTSATVSADIASLNFANAMQLTVGTNVQAGPTAATTSAGTVPTLAAASAAQATQNMLYGGTFVASAIYPVIAIGAANINNTTGNLGVLVYVGAREGIDIQNFKSGTSVTVNSPPSHTNAGLQGYVQYNSINAIGGTGSDAKVFKGALFFGGSYGYNYTSHGYARDYGFGTRVSSSIAQISFGILVNRVARITFSRAFGPSQTYIDSVSNTARTVNNFKTLSFGIAYQSPSPSEH